MTEASTELHPTLVGTDWLPAAERRRGVVSVIIPSYQHARFIPQAIRSVALQTHPDIELIIIDDGSTDGSVGVVLDSLAACGMDDAIVEVQENGGTGAAINRGLMRSTGEFLCVLNSDDYYHPQRIAELLRAMADEDSEFAFSEVKHVDEKGRPAELSASVGYRAWLNDVDLQQTTGFALLRWNGMVSSSNLMVAATVVERVGLFSGLRLASDWEYALRVLAETEPVFVRKELLHYRLHGAGTLLARGYSMADARVEFEQLMSTYFALVDGAIPANKVAPGPVAWPEEFERFLRISDFVRTWAPDFPTLWELWSRRASRPQERLMPPDDLITLVGGGGPEGFRAVGQEFRYRMVWAGLRPDHDLLDVGCGSGRIAVALVDYLTDEGSYTGFDVVDDAVEWCRTEITARHPNFTFDLVDVHSGFYRPEGSVSPVDFRFPYADDSFDFVTLTSVFTHLAPDAVDAYAAEIARVLRPGGRCFATFFLGNEHSYDALTAGVALLPFSADHGVYRTLADGPMESAVLHDEGSVRATIERHGLRLAEPIQYGNWADPASPLSLQDVAVFELGDVPTAREPSGLQVVAVTHRPAIFEQYVGSNEHIRRHPIVRYDNTMQNLPIPVRYNQFIDTEMGDGWVAFIHHDFAFDVDPLPVLDGVSQDHIYGVIGCKLMREGRYAFVGAPGRSPVRWERGEVRYLLTRGFVKCTTELTRSGTIGHRITEALQADTLDCCCLIVHSSLIRRYNLRFDERFDWHLYAEDFSLGARAHGIDTFALPIESGHYGISSPDSDEFRALLAILIEKYGPDFGSTCYMPPGAGRFKELSKLRGWMLRY